MELNENTPLNEAVPTKSKFMTKEDAGEEGLNLTIKGFSKEMVGEGADADERLICHFVEEHVHGVEIKPMVINKTNINRIGVATGANTLGDAKGKVINVYNDPFIEFKGEIKGGLRVRAAQGQEDGPNW